MRDSRDEKKKCRNGGEETVDAQIAPWLFIAEVMLQLTSSAWVVVLLFGSSSLFALITLPVDSMLVRGRKKLVLDDWIIRGGEQIAGVQKVFGGCVADAVSAIGSWIFYVFVLLSQVRSNR